MDKKDIQLVKKAKKDKKQYSALYDKYFKNIYKYFWYRVSKKKEVAEDLTQETFVKGFVSLKKFKNGGYSYLSYLKTIAHNLLVNYYRGAKSVVSLDKIGEIPVEINRFVERKIAAGALFKAIKQLDKQSQEIILMKYRDNLSIKEIAKKLNKTENSIKSLLWRARKKLACDEGFAKSVGVLMDCHKKGKARKSKQNKKQNERQKKKIKEKNKKIQKPKNK